MKKPIIGITLDNEEPGQYSKFPWYAIRKNYLHSIENVGGVPFPLFHSLSSIDNILDLINGVIITGGDFDINPSIYSQINNNSKNEKVLRTLFELKLCKKSLVKNIPILGICGGAQLINVSLGGSLIQDINSLDFKTLKHEQLNSRDQICNGLNQMLLAYSRANQAARSSPAPKYFGNQSVKNLSEFFS